MTIEEREEQVDRLEESRQVVRKAIDGLTDHQWRFVPAEGGWSIGQCLEHIAHIETRIIAELKENIRNSPADPQLPQTTLGKETFLKRGVPNRTRKVEMPTLFDYPQGTKPGTVLIIDFDAARDQTILFLRKTPVDLRQWGTEHMIFKTLNGCQWMLFIALHAERHAAQMEEIKLTDGFPV